MKNKQRFRFAVWSSGRGIHRTLDSRVVLSIDCIVYRGCVCGENGTKRVRGDASRDSGCGDEKRTADTTSWTVVDNAHLRTLTTESFSLRDRRCHCARLAFGNSFYTPAIFHLQCLMMHSKRGRVREAWARTSVLWFLMRRARTYVSTSIKILKKNNR